MTASEKLTVTGIRSPILYVPFGRLELTELTRGEVVSMIMFLLAPKEFAAPGAGSVRIAEFPAASLMAAPLTVTEPVLM